MFLQDIFDYIRLLFLKDKEPYLTLRKIIGFLPKDIRHYQTALKHKSVNTRNGDHKNNERLEFLGDAILGSVVADILYRKYPTKQEGFLTTLRSKIVKREMLNKLSEKIGLSQLISYSGSPLSSHNSYMNGNAFEALVGAIYLDRGYKVCKKFIEEKIVKQHINIEELEKTEENYKSRLIEWCQKYQLDCVFDIINEQAQPDNNSTIFTTRVTIEGIYCGTGKGYSKKESHQEAASQAYRKVTKNKQARESILQARELRKNKEPNSENDASDDVKS